MVAANASNEIDHFINNVVNKPESFFIPDQKLADKAIQIAKHFYDKVKQVEPVEMSPFNELLIQDFDNDQIWEEIAAQNEPFLQYAKSTLRSFSRKPTIDEHSEEEEETSVSGQSMDLDRLDQEGDYDLPTDEEEEEEEEMSQADSELEEDEYEEDIEKDEDEYDNGDDNIDDDDDERPKKTSEVDDDFFNLEKFNKWTEQQEELDMMSDREDDGFDFDEDLEDLEDTDDEYQDAAELTYEDFFGKKSKTKPKRPMKPKRQEEEEEEEESEDEQQDDKSESSVRNLFDDEEEEENGQEEKSAFQRQQERIAAQIEQFEEENIQDKHWTLRGEATASARPVNSLLEEDLEFEHANKPVPVITQETTNVLEDMIKKRIVDNMFDDVERKVDPTLRPFLPSKRVEISDEKSKKSLAEIYEDDYSKKKLGDAAVDERDEALKKEHEEITNMFNSLCHKLDALSNFHYTPKAPKPEMEIVSNAAAISMEEIIPVNVSDATLLAPEEVYEKKRGEVKATTEMDQAERKKARALKKKLKRKEKEMKEKEKKIIQKYNPKMAQKEEKIKAVKDLLGSKNVTIIGK
ncbi:Mpp10 protein [Rhizopus microsporus var. microsporus]|uniref:U3 small nucleolar ribonucleoprotein protein MPP10 n=2 Tax=Rhizopus microsporus TaxID=58291 RepID=A0A2G4SW89_RHIZD|nr:Mpp10 protein [Rhizopus microsporus ATCC 52813]ORE04347.1 Mpp10 protein [Rhizopus microsporus var. microsporus]PHZ13040.1 Mpp10 protein [Rhizopus microsporus ATCC 52813]